MRDFLDVRGLIHITGPVVFVILVLAAEPVWDDWVAGPAPDRFWPLVALSVLAVLASLYAPAGRRTVDLGTIVVAPAIWLYGVSWAAWSVAAVYVARELLRKVLFDEPLRRADSVRVLPTLSDAARVALATVAGGIVWVRGAGTGPASGVEAWAIWGVAAVATYVSTLWVLHMIESRWGRYPWRWLEPDVVQSSMLDACGWLLGALLTLCFVAVGETAALLLAAGMALLAGEAARNLYLRRRAVDRVTELWEVTRAGHRIIFREPDLAGMVASVHDECLKVLPFVWFQFELVQENATDKSWCAGPDGQIEEGEPRPADSPPALPGIHRGASWKIMQRRLLADGETIAHLRFWCDPRLLESTSVELLDSLLPQVSGSVHRALLDRQAKQDALTGLADRRVLETHLDKVFADTVREGGDMAVIMCDLDRFKKVNDTYGHDVGDRALLTVVRVLEEHRRDQDLCSRYGGEEFALVLEKTDGETAMRVAERLRTAVESTLFEADGDRIPLRLSAGVAAHPDLHVKAGKELLVLADEALIEAKRRGRNRSLLHQGRGRFRTTHGEILEDGPATVSEPAAPTLFA